MQEQLILNWLVKAYLRNPHPQAFPLQTGESVKMVCESLNSFTTYLELIGENVARVLAECRSRKWAEDLYREEDGECTRQVGIREDVFVESEKLGAADNRADTKPESPPRLTKRDLQILKVLKKLKALGQDSRKPVATIRLDVDKKPSVENLKAPMSKLKTFGYVSSPGSGRDSGYWITAKGIERIKPKKW